MIAKRLLRLALVLLFVLLFTWPNMHALADSGRITRGDIEGWFHALPAYFRLSTVSAEGVWAAAPLVGIQGRIAPFFTYEARYCVDDWHAVHLGWFTGGDKSFTYQDALSLSALDHTFILDGEVLNTIQSPIRQIAASSPWFPWEEYYGIIVGKILSPADLSVGEHTLEYTVIFPEGGSMEDTLTFYVDPPDSPTCQ